MKTLQEVAVELQIDCNRAKTFLKRKGFMDITVEQALTDEMYKTLIRKFGYIENNIEKEFIDDSPLKSDTKSQTEKDSPPYIINPSDVSIEFRNITLDSVIRKLQAGEIYLQPEFQKGMKLWSEVQQSQLIESILLRLPLPIFYFDEWENGNWAVIDGLQTLCSINNFITPDGYSLSGLQVLTHLEGKRFSTLERPLQRRIEEANLYVYLIKYGVNPHVKYILFQRINTREPGLTQQEIRHALNPMSVKLLDEMVELHSFKQATDYAVSSARMTNRDFANRFLAFYLFGYDKYKGNLDAFLNDGLTEIQKQETKEIGQIMKDFDEAMKTAWAIFGKKAFRKPYNKSEDRKLINKALFEVWSVVLAKLSSEERKIIKYKKKQVKSDFIQLMSTDLEFDDAITFNVGNKNRVLYRFNKIKTLVNNLKKNDK